MHDVYEICPACGVNHVWQKHKWIFERLNLLFFIRLFIPNAVSGSFFCYSIALSLSPSVPAEVLSASSDNRENTRTHTTTLRHFGTRQMFARIPLPAYPMDLSHVGRSFLPWKRQCWAAYSVHAVLSNTCVGSHVGMCLFAIDSRTDDWLHWFPYWFSAYGNQKLTVTLSPWSKFPIRPLLLLQICRFQKNAKNLPVKLFLSEIARMGSKFVNTYGQQMLCY